MLLGGLLAALCLAGCGTCGGSRSPQVEALAPVSPPQHRAADRPGRPATAGAILGINEGVSVPRAWVRAGRVDADAEAALLAEDAREIVELGARAVRANTATYPWLSRQAFVAEGESFERADRWVRTVQDAGLEPLVMLGPWPGNQTAAYTEAYVPADLAAYQRWVGSVVERYDGDGIDDMPGLLRPVRHWEVDNEPDLHNSVAPRDGGASVPPEQFQTPAQYATVLVATAQAIRAADPAAVVLSAGFYRPHTDNGRKWIAELLAQPGARDAFDVLSLHCYSDRDELGAQARTIETWQALLPDKPLWVTETSVASQGKARHIDENWQARMVAGIYGVFLAGGADRIFWHTLADPPPTTRDRGRLLFSTHSLREKLDGGGSRLKPSGQVYQRLAALLADVDPDSLVEVPAEGGRLLRAGDGWLAFWGRPAVPPGAATATDLLTGETSPVQDVVQAPAWLAPPR